MEIKTFTSKKVIIGEGYLYNLLNEVLHEKRYAEYVGGTLFLKVDGNLFAFNVGRKFTNALNRMIAKLYLKYKTPEHAYYKLAESILN